MPCIGRPPRPARRRRSRWPAAATSRSCRSPRAPGPTRSCRRRVKSLIPTVEIAPAVGWPAGATPAAAAGLTVTAFASGLDHPRWLYVLPNGDVLVAETNAPAKPDDAKGLKGWITGHGDEARRRRDAERQPHHPAARRSTATASAETRTLFLAGLNSPFGMALVGQDLYVADTDALLRFPYVAGATQITAAPTKVVDLPAGTINHHWTKNVIASRDGQKLYVTVGSNSNVAENGIDAEDGRAAIWEVDPTSGQHRIFASGLRNPNGMAWQRRHACGPSSTSATSSAATWCPTT